MAEPRAIGFWRSGNRGDEQLPYPWELVRRKWISADKKALLVTYLKAGATCESYRGMSYCRFRCGIEDSKMGHRDFTDGIWIWPEGLYHYVEQHELMLPNDFVAHCEAGNWIVPADAAQGIRVPDVWDYSYWIAWARNEIQNAEAPRSFGGRTQGLIADLYHGYGATAVFRPKS